MSVVAAWRLHKELKGKMSHLQFRREIVRTLFGKAPDKRLDLVSAECRLMEQDLEKFFMLVNLLQNKDVANNAKKIPYT